MKKLLKNFVMLMISMLFVCPICSAEVKKEYSAEKHEFSISSRYDMPNKRYPVQSMDFFKTINFGGKYSYEHPFVLKAVSVVMISDKYINILAGRVQQNVNSQRISLEPMNTKAFKKGNYYVSTFNFLVAPTTGPEDSNKVEIKGQSPRYSNNSVSNFIQSGTPFYFVFHVRENNGVVEVVYRMDGQQLQECKDIIDYQLENDPEWKNKISLADSQK